MATSNATANMCRRQAFTGKGITFIEMMFDDEMVTTSTTPDTKDSVFNEMSKLVGTFGTIIAQSYALGCKATEKDAALATSITPVPFTLVPRTIASSSSSRRAVAPHRASRSRGRSCTRQASSAGGRSADGRSIPVMDYSGVGGSSWYGS